MKKIIFLIMMIFVLTGCSVEYNLTITKDNIFENINVISETTNESNIISNYYKPIEAFQNSPVYSESNEKLPNVEYYTTNKLINNGLYTLNINYNFDYEDFRESNIINHSVSVLKIEEKRGTYTLNSGATIKIFDSYDINNLTIKITLDENLELINSNADSVNGNEYTWNVTKENYKTSPITLSYKEKKEETPQNPENPSTGNENKNPNISEEPNVNSSNDIILVAFSFIGFIVVLILILIFSKKIRK